MICWLSRSLFSCWRRRGSWFHDQPKSGVAASSSVELISEDSAGQTRTYRLAATALSPEKRDDETDSRA